MFTSLPEKVSVYEVSPRDGLQNESASVPTHAKMRLIEALADAGLKRIEITSYVSPRWIPQLADAKEVSTAVRRLSGFTPSALCPNRRGLERALEGGVPEIAVFISASETHNKKNVNKSVAQTLAAFDEVITPALEANLKVRGYVSTVWGCPYEGEIALPQTINIVGELLDRGCYEISLGDTIGIGTPLQTQRIMGELLERFPREKLAMHMHDTRGTALANVLVGLEMGITTFDASVGGLGGCPYAPGAAGNLATEDLVFALHGMGVETGVDLPKLWEAGRVAAAIVGRELPGKVHKAGVQSLAH